MRKCSIALAAVLALFVGVTMADAARGQNGPATKPVRAVLRGNGATAPAQDTDTDGDCNVSPWVDNCVSGNCSCLQINNTTIRGSFKSGATLSNFFVTIDNGVDPATEPAVGDGPIPHCDLFLGVATVTSKGGASSRTINLVGTSCRQIVGVSAKNPSGKHKKDLIQGGWGISSDPAPSPDQSGWGTLTGQEISSNHQVTMKLSGWVTQ